MWYRKRAMERIAVPSMVPGLFLLLAGCGGASPHESPRDEAVGRDPTPPLMTLVYPGAPCALVNPGPASPGPCQAGRARDSRYLAFELPANRDIEVGFDKTIDPATLVLGTACGVGTVRVERLGPDGACVGAMPGRLVVRARGFRFVPDVPWIPGRPYRLVLIPGRDDDCDPGDICGRNGLPLDTNPLAGTGEGEGGGPPLVVAFTAVPPTEDALLLLSTLPPGGVPEDDGDLSDQDAVSRVGLAITDTSGIVTGARIDQADCLPDTPQVEGCVYLTADLPVSIGALQTDCTMGEDARGAPIEAGLCIPVRIHPGILYGSSLTLDADVVGLGIIDDLQTGPLVMRLREGPDDPIIGSIVGTPEGTLRFVVDLDLYLDAPDLRILGGLASHDLRSKPLSLSLAGPVSFLEGGRVVIELTNTEAAALDVNVSALLGGTIRMQIPANAARLRLVRAPPE